MQGWRLSSEAGQRLTINAFDDRARLEGKIMTLLFTEIDQAIGTITLNRLDKRNSLNLDLLDELVSVLGELWDQQAKVVVLRAPKGTKVWSAGFDLDQFSDSDLRETIPAEPFEPAMRAIRECPVPVLAMVEGGVWGGACDMIIGCDSATFTLTPAKVGVPYTTSGLIQLVRTVGFHSAKELLFTAKSVQAEKALKLGLINHLVAAEELESFTYDLARRIASNSSTVIKVLKEQMHLLAEMGRPNRETQDQIEALRTDVFESDDFLKGR